MFTSSHHLHTTGLFLLIFCVNLLLFQVVVKATEEGDGVIITSLNSNTSQQVQLQLQPPPLQLASSLKLVETTIRIVDIINEDNQSPEKFTNSSLTSKNNNSESVQYATIERYEGRLPHSKLFNLPHFYPLRDVTVKRGRKIVVSQAKAQQIAQIISELDTSEVSSPRSRHHRSTTPVNEEGDKKEEKVKKETIKVDIGDGNAILVTSTFSYAVTSEPEKESDDFSEETSNRKVIQVVPIKTEKEGENVPPELSVDEQDEYEIVPVTLNYKVTGSDKTFSSKINDDKNDKIKEEDDEDEKTIINTKYKNLKLNKVKSSGPKKSSESEASRDVVLNYITTESPSTNFADKPTIFPTVQPDSDDEDDDEHIITTTEPSTIIKNEDPLILLEESEPSSQKPTEKTIPTTTNSPSTKLTETTTFQTPLYETETTTPTTTETPTTTFITSTNFTQSRSIESTFFTDNSTLPKTTSTSTLSPSKDTVQVRYRSTSLRPEDKNLFELLYTIFLLNRFEKHAQTTNKTRRPVKKIRIKIMEFTEEESTDEKKEIQQIEVPPSTTTPMPIPSNESVFYTERIQLGSPFSTYQPPSNLNYSSSQPIEVKLRITGIINENRTSRGGNGVRRTSTRIKPMELSLKLNYSMRSDETKVEAIDGEKVELAELFAMPLDARLRVGETILDGGGDDDEDPLLKLDSRTSRSDYPDGEKEVEESNELTTKVKFDDDETVLKKNKYANLKLNKVKSSGPKVDNFNTVTTSTETPTEMPREEKVKFYQVKKVHEEEHTFEDIIENAKVDTTTMFPTTENPEIIMTRTLSEKPSKIPSSDQKTPSVPEVFSTKVPTTAITTTFTETSTTPANITAELLNILDSQTPSSTTTSIPIPTFSSEPTSTETPFSSTSQTVSELPQPVFRPKIKNKTSTTTSTTTSTPQAIFISSTTTTTRKPKLLLGSILKITTTTSSPEPEKLATKRPESERSFNNDENPTEFQLIFLLALALIIVFCILCVTVFCFINSTSVDKNKTGQLEEGNVEADTESEIPPPPRVTSAPLPVNPSPDTITSRHVKWLDIERELSIDENENPF